MGRSLWRSLVELTKTYRIFIGFIPGLLGVMKAMGVDYIPFPPWFWWLSAIIIFFSIAWRLQWLLDRQNDTIDAKRPPDLSLEEVVKRVAKLDQFKYEGQQASDALDLIRKYASRDDAAFRVFGVSKDQPRTLHPDRELPEKIDSAFWKDHQISYMEFIQDRSGLTERATAGASSNEYRNLQFLRCSPFGGSISTERRG